MNNTSAYANVLLKSPALQTATTAAATPKRDYENDAASADFQQTFKAAHDNQKSQDEKVSKSANPKKSTHVEHRNEAKNNKDVKHPKATNETHAKQKTAYESNDVNRNTIGSEVVPEQPVQSQHKDQSKDQNNHTDAKSFTDNADQEAKILAADINANVPQNALTALNILNGVDAGVIASTLAVSTELAIEIPVPMVADVLVKAELVPTQEVPISADIKAVSAPPDEAVTGSPLLVQPAAVNVLDVEAVTPSAINSATLEVIDPNLSLPQASIKPDSGSTLNLVAEVPTKPNATTLESESPASVSLSSSAPVSVDKSSQPLMANEPLLKQNLAQQLSDNSLVVSVNQPINAAAPADAQALAAGMTVSVAPTKPLQPQVALADTSKPTELVDEGIDLLVPLLPEASASAKVVPTNNPVATTNTVNPEVTTAQLQMNASKTAFEKTLQAIVSPDANSADDIAAPIPSSSSTSSATNSLLDSLMRGADQQTPAARNFVVQTAVPVPVGQPQWSQAVGEKVLWLAAQNVSSAEINLHPKDLGPIQVRVSVNQEQTTVNFTSHHAVVREVLDQNLNRLRDMFSEQGLNLVNVDVSDKSFSRQQGDAQGQKGQGSSQDVGAEEETAIAMSAIVQQRLVDHYA